MGLAGFSLCGMNGGSAVLGSPSLRLGLSMCVYPPCTSFPERWSVKQDSTIRMEWGCQDWWSGMLRSLVHGQMLPTVMGLGQDPIQPLGNFPAPSLAKRPRLSGGKTCPGAGAMATR